MAITSKGIELTINYWANQWDKIEILNNAGTESVEKVPVTQPEDGYLESIVFFGHNEGNFHIEKVRTYAGNILVAENAVDFIKTDRQSLTLVRKDHLVEGT